MSATSALAAAPTAIAVEPVSASTTDVEATAAKAVEAETSSETTPEATPTETVKPPATEPIAETVGTAHSTSSAPAANEREQAVARIRQSALPPALRERLAAVVEAGQSPSLDVAACLEAIEQTLPDFLRGNRDHISRLEHPIGNAFFQAGDAELSDAEAEALAQRQLARSGLLRGQRVKVAD